MAGAPLTATPDEQAELFARETPSDIRLAARMPGKAYTEFHTIDQTWAFMLERGLITQEVYEDVQQGRFSYKQKIPAAAAPDYIEKVGQAKNSVPLLAMVSQAAGYRRKGDQLEAILRQEVPGLDPRSIVEHIMDPLVQDQISLRGGLEMLQVAAKKKVEVGEWEDDEAKKFVELSRKFAPLLEQLVGAGAPPDKRGVQKK